MDDVNNDPKRYISESLKSGKTKEEIARSLMAAGWSIYSIEKTIHFFLERMDRAQKNTASNTAPSLICKNGTDKKFKFGYTVFIVTVVAFSGLMFMFWQNQLDLTKINTRKVRDFYTRLAQSQISFTDAGKMVFPDEQKFIDKKTAYGFEKKDFVEINLRTMKISLYKKGALIKKMEVLTKGKEGGWWETPTGNYKILGKEINHFSSIGKVWMPYSVQFYGNYFIHGWPYYDNGTPVAPSYSGGCVRLSNKDANTVFNFVDKNTHVLVLGDKKIKHFGMLKPKAVNVSIMPAIDAKSFLIYDLSSNTTIVEKNADEKLPIASLTKLATAVVAHEMIYLGRKIKAAPQTLAGAYQVFKISKGNYYRGFDLLYLLLMQSSNEAAETLASFLGEKNFVKNMNAKTASLKMNDTNFNDPSGISAKDVSTARDISKLLEYIYYNRYFIFDITKGKVFKNAGLIRIGDTINIGDLKNFNEFSAQPNLIGMKNGETKAAMQTIATVWNIETPQGNVPIGIIILGSKNRVKDTRNLLMWFYDNYETL